MNTKTKSRVYKLFDHFNLGVNPLKLYCMQPRLSEYLRTVYDNAFNITLYRINTNSITSIDRHTVTIQYDMPSDPQVLFSK